MSDTKYHPDFRLDDAPAANPDGFVPDPEQKDDWVYLKNGMRVAGKTLDYLRGITGGPLMALGLELGSGKDVFRPKELLNAANPTKLDTFPSSDELLERAGVPKGARLSDVTPIPEDSMFNASVRGAGGFVGDAISDPLTYLSLGANRGAKALEKNIAEKIATAPSTATAATGKKIFSAGITPIEQAGEKYGKNEVADTMYKYGIKGTADQIDTRLQKVADTLKEGRDQILTKADEAGGTLNREEAFHNFLNEIDGMVIDRRLSQEEADAIVKDAIGTYKEGADPNLMLASQWKTDVTKSLPQKAYDRTKNSTLGQTLTKHLGQGLREGVEQGVGKVSGPEAMAQLAEKNKELGELLTVKNPAGRMADASERKAWITPWDVGIGTGAGVLANDPGKGAAILAAKKAMDLSRTPWFRTNTGSALRFMGESPWIGPAIDTITRAGVSRATRKGPQNEEN